ncbi:MAG: cytidine deaminase [Verrucomicrobiota bacterium]
MTEDIRILKLQQAAREAAEAAYSPYSEKPVGAAVRTTDGDIYTGCVVENACYNLSICAEQSAIYNAVGDGAKRIEALAVYSLSAEDVPACGCCLHVLNEFSDDAEVITWNENNDAVRKKVSTLLRG